MRILCEAISFGFGPVSKLLSLCELLNQKHSLSFIGSGCSLTLANKTNFFENIIVFDTTSSTDFNNTISFEEYDIVISVMNPIFGRAVINNNCKLVVIDSLFTMWDRIDPIWEKCDLLVIQSFFGEKNRLKISHNLSNAHIVGPIISPQIEQKIKSPNNTLLINFGGADYPYIRTFKDISIFIKKFVIELTSINMFDEMIIAIGPRGLAGLQDLIHHGFKLFTFSHDDFLQQLSKSDTLFTIPGLTTAFESFHLAIPTLFLPPLNYSQFLNLRTFRLLGLSYTGAHWDDHFSTPNTNQLTEKEGVQMVESLVAKAHNDPTVLSTIVKGYKTILQDKHSLESMASKQNNFYKSLGCCGTYEAVELIEGLI